MSFVPAVSLARKSDAYKAEPNLTGCKVQTVRTTAKGDVVLGVACENTDAVELLRADKGSTSDIRNMKDTAERALLNGKSVDLVANKNQRRDKHWSLKAVILRAE
jgi:hypothetical protein